MIELTGVYQHYGVRPVLQDIHLRIEAGSTVAIVGPNGMGKTTLMGVLAGVLTPQRGTVLINGHRRRGSVEEELAIRRQVAYLPDQPWLPKNRTGREFLLAVGRLYELADDRLMDHADRLLELFQLTREGDWPIRSYSHGQKKKIALSAALITECPILLLDEPFGGGLDPAGIVALQHVLKRLGQKSNYTLIMTAPAPDMVEKLAQRIVVLREGRVAAFDTLEGLRKQTGCYGSLTEVVGNLIQPDTLKAVERYFEGNASHL
jgi:ABC-2 type transport system ATP-binding protein